MSVTPLEGTGVSIRRDCDVLRVATVMCSEEIFPKALQAGSA
jgi:hypothetical protein